MGASARDSWVIELIEEESAHDIQRQPCRLKLADVDHEPMRHSHPQIKPGINASTDGPSKKKLGVVQEDLVVAHLNAYGGQTNQCAVKRRGQRVMRLRPPQGRMKKLCDLGVRKKRIGFGACPIGVS